MATMQAVRLSMQSSLKWMLPHQRIGVPSWSAYNAGNLLQYRCFGGADMKVVSNRMKSVKSTQKITKAMKMVSASKLKSDQRRLDIGSAYGTVMQRLMHRLPLDSEENSDLTILAMSSDQGLCGGVNSAIAKQTTRLMLSNEASGATVSVIGIGDKIRSALQRLFGNRLNRIFNEVTKIPWNFGVACVVADRILQENPSRLAVVHNHFKSVISYDTTVLKLLTEKKAGKMNKPELDALEFEPELPSMWQDLHQFYVTSTIFSCMLDNIASEQSARMTAMDNASTNALEIISSLTLKYNRARQAKITLELIEIISGASAL